MKSVQISQNAKSIIPKNWQLKKLKEIASIESGFGFPIKYQGKSEGDIPFFKVSDISRTVLQGGIYLTRADNFISHEDCKIIKAKPLRKGTIVFARIGEAIKLNRRAILGQDSLIDNNIAGVFSNSNNLYLYYCLLNIKFGDFTGITAVPSLKKSDIENQIILFPSEQEQQKIASILSNVDELIQKTDQIIEQTQRLKKGLMQRLLTKGIGHTKFNDLIEVSLGSLITLQRGHDLPLQSRQSGDVPVIGANGITGYHNKVKAKGPGVLMGRSGTLGKIYYIDRDYWPLNTSLYVKEFKNCVPLFIYYYLHTIDYNKYNAGSTVPTMNRNLLHPIIVRIPKSKENQEKIALILLQTDELIKKQQLNKFTLESLKKGLMQQLLTGKIRVKV